MPGRSRQHIRLEVSRLARSNADLARLLELARLTDTLVIDTDGVYDLADYSDRLILGFKSQMSEAELHILSEPLAGRQTCRRGAAADPFPPLPSAMCTTRRERR